MRFSSGEWTQPVSYSTMEREPLPLRPKLRVAVSIDYPAASGILVSFPDKWELICQMKREGTPLYIAAWPPSEEKADPEHFHGLSPEINLELTTYRLYRFFQPWPMPSFTVAWDKAAGKGQVVGGGPLTVQLQPLGQAQTWCGPNYGVLWECYAHETTRRKADWQEMLYEIWQTVEKNMEVGKIFTQPHEPAFEGDYTEFLSRLDYHPDPESPGWWSKGQ